MKNVSLKLDDSVYQETEQVLGRIKKPGNGRINEALQHYNQVQKMRVISELLEKESRLVSEESLKVLAEFANLEFY